MNRSTTIAAVAACVIIVACTDNSPPYDRCLDSRDVPMCHAVVNAGGDADSFISYGMQGYLIGMMNGQQYVYHDDHYRGPSHYYPQNVRETRVIIDRRPVTVNTIKQQQFALQKAKSAGTVKPYVPGAYKVKSTTVSYSPASTKTSSTAPVPAKSTTTTSSSYKTPTYSYKPSAPATSSYKSTTTTTSYSSPSKSYSSPSSSYSSSSSSRSYSSPSYSSSSSMKK